MASETSIINRALTKLGVATITVRTEDSPQARLANITFDEARDDLMRDHPWNWAVKRTSLAASATAPTWNFTYAYIPPVDMLRLWEVDNPSGYEYRIESTTDGPVIVTDLGAPLKIAYIAKITDPNQMDEKFREALSARLAMEWAEPLTAVSTITDKMELWYMKALRDAKAVDGQEESPRQFNVDTWITSRY